MNLKDEWCPICLRWETPEQWDECDRELYEAGYGYIGRALVLVEPPDVSNEMEGG